MTYFWFRTGPLYVPWISVLVCFDRLMSLQSVKLKQLFAKRWMKITLVATIIIITTPLNSGYFTNSLSLFNGEMACFVQSSDMLTLSYYYDVFVMTVVPFVCMLVCNILIAIRLFALQKRTANPARAKKDIKLVTTSIAINITFFIFYTPACVFEILSINYLYANNYNSLTDCYYYVLFSILNNFSFILRAIYAAIQFFINIAINSKYRNNMGNLCCKFSRKRD